MRDEVRSSRQGLRSLFVMITKSYLEYFHDFAWDFELDPALLQRIVSSVEARPMRSSSKEPGSQTRPSIFRSSSLSFLGALPRTRETRHLDYNGRSVFRGVSKVGLGISSVSWCCDRTRRSGALQPRSTVLRDLEGPAVST